MESKALIIFLVVLVMSMSIIYARISLSIEEDMELERQIKTLNKVPVKTIKTGEGEIIDCIDIFKQPAFDHPRLTNHKIQMEPSSIPNGGVAPKINLSVIAYGCPEGTVPIERITKEDLMRTKSLSDYPFSNQNDIKNSAGVHMLGLAVVKRVGPLLGATGNVGVFNLTNVTAGQYSSNHIWVQSGSGDTLSFLAAGWRVSPQLNGDGLSRLFTYWTNAYKSGCYNLRCPGFVLVNKDISINIPMDKLKLQDLGNPAGINLPILIHQDRQSKNWWLVLNDINVGYWPNEIFTTLRKGADLVAWGGVTSAGPDGISPPMGSGVNPNDPPYGNYYPNRGHFLNDIGYVTSINEILKPYPHEAIVMNDTSGCYDIHTTHGYIFDFIYGGHGGKCVEARPPFFDCEADFDCLEPYCQGRAGICKNGRCVCKKRVENKSSPNEPTMFLPIRRQTCKSVMACRLFECPREKCLLCLDGLCQCGSGAVCHPPTCKSVMACRAFDCPPGKCVQCIDGHCQCEGGPACIP